MTVQNVSRPEELQKIHDQEIGIGMVGIEMGKFMQYQTAQAIPKFAKGVGGESGVAGDATGLGAGVALGQVLAQNLQAGLQSPPVQAAAVPAGVNMVVKADDVMATLEKLGELKVKGILTQEEFDANPLQLGASGVYGSGTQALSFTGWAAAVQIPQGELDRVDGCVGRWQHGFSERGQRHVCLQPVRRYPTKHARC